MHIFIHRSHLHLVILLIVSAIVVDDSVAQGFSWPEEPENLTVLPASVKGEQLGQIMRSWTRTLGVRCSHCHVGEGPLSDYDFVSDEKPAKEKTRIMVRLTRSINQNYLSQLAYVEDEPHDRVRVSCMTCHRTLAKPVMLEDVLAETYETDGIETMLTSYDELRENYYGGFAYDFRPGTLIRLSEELAEDGHVDAALAALDKEIELHDDFTEGYVAKGGLLANEGRKDEALAAYEKALEVAPERGKRFVQQMIDELKEN